MAEFFCVIITILWVASFTYSSEDVCKQTSPCICEFNEYSKIDITNIVAHNEEPLQDELKEVTFYFYGCRDTVLPIFKNTTDKSGSLLQRFSNNTVEVLGKSQEIKILPAQGLGYQLIYTNKENINASVKLSCDKVNVPYLKVLPDSSNTLNFIVSSPHACRVTQSRGLSAGSVLVILFFAFTGSYFLGGALILYFIRGARGVELVPNVDFWRSIPGLVKDGVIFIFSGCNPTAISTPDSYDRI